MSSLIGSAFLCLIAIQERASSHELSSIFNTKSNFKNKQAKTSFIQKVN